MEFDDTFAEHLIKIWTTRLSFPSSDSFFFNKTINDVNIDRKKRQIKKIVKKEIDNKVEKIEYLKGAKTGNDSFRLIFRGYYLKCYECWTPEYASKVKIITETLNRNNIHFPRVILTNGRYVISEWLDGKNMVNEDLNNDNLFQKLAKYQASIHACTYPNNTIKNWEVDHYMMFLLGRLLVYGKKYLPIKDIIEICKDEYELKPHLELSITHPDFTLRNMVLSNDKIMIVDNETLNVDKGYEYDILNAKKWFFPGDEKKQELYIEAYSRYHDVGSLMSASRFWDILWKIRMAGSDFQRNNIDKGKKIIKNVQEELAKGVI